MYNQNHTQHHNGMINGTGGSRFTSMMNMNGSRPVQHHAHQSHAHHNQQHQEHGSHATHQPNYVSHQHNQSGGTLSNTANHFTPSHLQNGTPNNGYSTPAKPITEHWQKQVEIAERERQMTTAHPHARNASSASKTIMPGTTNGFNKDGEKEERYRTGAGMKGAEVENQIWFDLDMGGANLRVMGPALFSYTFLTRLYFNNNKLKFVPPAIGRLQNLNVLDLSLNELTDLPAEMGMLVNLKDLLLVDNQLEMLPFELGNLFQLQMLAVDGNPLIEDQRNIISEAGVAGIIDYLRENAPSKCQMRSSNHRILLISNQHPNRLKIVNGLCSMIPKIQHRTSFLFSASTSYATRQPHKPNSVTLHQRLWNGTLGRT
jgi:CCR4-NOT transcription complex subunit 6